MTHTIHPKSRDSLLSTLLVLLLSTDIALGFTSLRFRSTSTLSSLQSTSLTGPRISNAYLNGKSSLNLFSRNEETTVSKKERSSKTELVEESPHPMTELMGFFDSSTEVQDLVTDEKLNVDQSFMGDLVEFLGRGEEVKETGVDALNPIALSEEEEEQSLGRIVAIGGVAALVSATVALVMSGDLNMIITNVQSFFADPTSTLEGVVESVESMGPLGFFYFGAVYTVAEILAIPAIPLTASAGYLFGTRDGTAIVLLSASIAAAVSFVIGRTFLRTYVEKALKDYPDFQKIDKAIGEEGFKIMLLLRVSPIFPFALSNYLYGVTSIKFWPYFWGTMIGFTPGTIAYVFTGEIGKSLTLDSASAEPWYVYAGGLALLSGFIKVVSDVATGIIEKVQEEED